MLSGESSVDDIRFIIDSMKKQRLNPAVNRVDYLPVKKIVT